jgi:hypothetical protein
LVKRTHEDRTISAMLRCAPTNEGRSLCLKALVGADPLLVEG